MGFIGTLLLLLLIFFFVIPAIRVGWALYRARHAARSFFKDAFGTGNTSQRQRRDNQPPSPRAKKIARDVGEYVAFEEISSTASSDTGTASKEEFTSVSESQVEDAEWEEIN